MEVYISEFQAKFSNWCLMYLLWNCLQVIVNEPTDDSLTLVQVMAWCCQATNHSPSQYWASSSQAYGIIMPRVKAWAKWPPCYKQLFQILFLEKLKFRFLIQLSLTWMFIRNGQISNKSASVQVLACHQAGNRHRNSHHKGKMVMRQS